MIGCVGVIIKGVGREEVIKICNRNQGHHILSAIDCKNQGYLKGPVSKLQN